MTWRFPNEWNRIEYIEDNLVFGGDWDSEDWDDKHIPSKKHRKLTLKQVEAITHESDRDICP